jgi:vacuolar-type H+-ATPase subunit I/STV1
MSDDAALSGAMMLSQQLEMYRWMDALERARNNNELAIDNGLLRRDAEQIVGRYNLLVAEFNDLLRRATEVAKEADRKDSIILGLQREAEALRNAKTALEAECERLRQENKATWSEVQLLRNIVRQDHPDMYLPDC